MLEYKKNLKNIGLNFVSSNNSLFDITLWTDYKDDEIIFSVQNNSSQPVLDFVLYADKIYKSELDLIKSPHTREVVFGTIPSKTTFIHNETHKLFENNVYGFPLLSGQFSDKQGRHWAINETLSINQIEFRAPFD